MLDVVRLATLTLAVSGVAAAAGSDNGAGGGCILYGEKWAVALSAPPTWKIECRGASSGDVEVALWPKGSSWSDAVVVMYVTSSLTRDGESLEAFANDEVARFKKEHPSAKAVRGSELRTGDGRPALVRHFSGDENGNREAVAYIDAGSARLIFALSSRKKREYRAHLSDFNILVTKAIVMKAEVGK